MRFSLILQDFFAFGKCIKIYTQKRASLWITRFEKGKGYLVDFLLARRGIHNRSFLHLSLVMLITSGVVTAPIIASSYPGGASKELLAFTPPSAVLGALTTASQETSTVISDKPRDQVINYEVQKGDTLGAIGDKFGISVDTIKWANNLKDERLSIGQIIKIPPVTGIVYKVKAGDTIYSIAKFYKTDAQKIVNFPFNDFTDLDTFALAIGQSLIVPDGVMPEAKPVFAPTVPMSQLAGGSGQFAWPVGGSITQYPVWYHMAVDIANSAAPGIAAAGNGKVIFVDRQKYNYGWHIIVDDGDGLTTLYAHLSDIYVEPGQEVSRGQIIGKMGSTGRSTGTHLHFEVRKNGVSVNPLPFLK
ncbi:MAG: M23 family metallopeptidase [Candidatus Gottesmanbacteria bacterium]